jgi:hypothetical protein
MNIRPARLFTCALSVSVLGASAGAATSYANLTTRVGTMHTHVFAGLEDGREVGNTVSLAGHERAVTRVDVALRIGNSGVAQFDAQLRLYANDGPQGGPGSLLWSSEPRRLIIDSGADLVYAFPAPNVVVPDTLTWTIEVTGRTGANQSAISLPHYSPPSIGSAASGYWIDANGVWEFGGQGTPAFGARIITAPACSADFNHDGDTGTDQDIEAFFACLAGNCCATCGSADFNNDGDTGTDQDIESFFRVLAGGNC